MSALGMAELFLALPLKYAAEAAEHDRQGRHAEAFQKYRDAIAAFMEVHNVEKNPQRRAVLDATVRQYIARAEELMVILTEQGSDTEGSGSESDGATSSTEGRARKSESESEDGRPHRQAQKQEENAPSDQKHSVKRQPSRTVENKGKGNVQRTNTYEATSSQAKAQTHKHQHMHQHSEKVKEPNQQQKKKVEGPSREQTAGTASKQQLGASPRTDKKHPVAMARENAKAGHSCCFTICRIWFALAATVCLAWTMVGFFRMPAPYDNVFPAPLSEYHLSALRKVAANRDATGRAEKFLFERHSVQRVIEVNSNNTRELFKGIVVGAESVQYNKWTDQLMVLARTGDLYTAPLGPCRRTQKESCSASASNAGTLAGVLPEKITYIGPGRPLGYDVYGPNSLVVADSLKGLLFITGIPEQNSNINGTYHTNVGGVSGVHMEVLVNAFDGKPLNYVNDVSVVRLSNESDTVAAKALKSNTVVYFTSSSKFPVVVLPTGERNADLQSYVFEGYYDTLRSFILGAFSGDCSGRVFRYNMATRTNDLLIQGLWFANGVAHGRSEEGHEFILAVETMGFRVYKKWLSGPNARFADQDGIVPFPSDVQSPISEDTSIEIVLEGVPGMLDGISEAADGKNFWLAVASPLPKLLVDVLSFAPPAVRAVIANLYVGLDLAHSPMVKYWGMAIKMSPKGEVLEVVADWTGQLARATSAITELPDGSGLLFGSLGGDSVAFLEF